VDQFLSDASSFHFIRLWFLLAILPAVVIAALLWFKKSNHGPWQHIISPHLLPHLLQGSSKKDNKLPIILLLIGWVLASIAMAGPTWSKLPQTVQKKVNARVILLDLSLSMLAQDIKPSRLIRAQHKLSDILDLSEEGLTGLITYAGTSHVVSPLTDDTHTILSMVTSLSPEIMPIKGSNPASAIEKAAELLQQAGVNEGQILLITDDLPASFVNAAKQSINPSLTPVSVFAIGTNDGAPIPLSQGSFIRDRDGSIVVPKLNTQRLKATANALNGRFSTLSSDDEDINYLLGNSSRLLNDEMKETDRDFDTWEESGLALVLLLLPLAAIGYRKGWLSFILLPLVFTISTPSISEANTWDDLWTTKDQQGQQAWRNNELQKASGLFESPEWKASAQYKSGDYQGSAETLKEHVTSDIGNTADNHYNLGNALAKQQDIEGALTAYDKALELDPEMEDAKANKTTLAKIQKVQQKQQGDGDNKDGEKQEGDENQEESDQQSSDQEQQQDESNQQQGESESEQQEQDQQQSPSDQQDSEQQEQQDASQQSQSEEQSQEEKDAQAKQAEDEQNQEEQEQQATQQEIQESNLDKEDQQALEQWLRRIPDDPGGLLRRKFAQESKLRRNQPAEGKQW